MTRSKLKIVIALLLLAAIAFASYLFLRKPAVPPAPSVEEEGPGDILQKKGALSPEKIALKQKIIAPLGGSAGGIYETTNFRISYLPSPDIFQGEIKTTYISQAKEEAIEWFKKQGFTEADICALPVNFYLGGEAFEQYQGSGLIFNPLPDFCQ